MNEQSLNEKENLTQNLLSKIVSIALRLPNAVAMAFVYFTSLFFIGTQISFFFYLQQLKETRASNIAQAEKPGDFVIHNLEYGWRNGVKLVPRYINREKTAGLKLAGGQLAQKLAPAPGVDSPIAGVPSEVSVVSPDFSLPPVVNSPLDPFSIHQLLGNFFFSFTNLSLSTLLTLGFALLGLCFFLRKRWLN